MSASDAYLSVVDTFFTFGEVPVAPAGYAVAAVAAVRSVQHVVAEAEISKKSLNRLANFP